MRCHTPDAGGSRSGAARICGDGWPFGSAPVVVNGVHGNKPSSIDPGCITITPRSYLLLAVPIVAGLAAMGALAIYSTYVLGHGSVFGLVRLFNLDAEANIPTFFSSLNLALCGFLLVATGVFARNSGRPFFFSWLLLGLGALFVAIDEAAQIHELLDSNTEWTGGLLQGEDSPWVIVYTLIALGFAVAALRLFLHLPRRYQVLFGTGAALFVGGSVGLEVVGAMQLVDAGKTAFYAIVNGSEEVIEMAAVTLVNASILSYIRATHGPLMIGTR